MKIFWTILKYFGIFAGSISVLYGVFLYFDNMNDDISDIKETVDYINIEQTWIAKDITAIQDTLAEFESEHKKQGADIKSISWGLKNHENFTPDQFEEIMEELLKKNTSSILPLLLPGPDSGNMTYNSPHLIPYRNE